MCLNISEELSLLRITMPQSHLADRTCPTAFVAWNGKEQSIRYFTVLLVQGQKAQLHERLEDGTDVSLGDAPEEGNELTTIIDRIQGSRA